MEGRKVGKGIERFVNGIASAEISPILNPVSFCNSELDRNTQRQPPTEETSLRLDKERYYQLTENLRVVK